MYFDFTNHIQKRHTVCALTEESKEPEKVPHADGISPKHIKRVIRLKGVKY